MSEQLTLFEAADVEESIPSLLSGRRGIPVIGHHNDHLTAELHRYTKQRQLEKEQQAQKEAEKEKEREHGPKTQFGGEKRAEQWLERHRSKAEKHGQSPPSEQVMNSMANDSLAAARRGIDETLETFRSLTSPTAGAQTLANFQSLLSPGANTLANFQSFLSPGGDTAGTAASPASEEEDMPASGNQD